MTDSRLQELKRAWEASGSVEDEAAYLRERVRAGDLTQERLELAAYCGHEAAEKVTTERGKHTLPAEPEDDLSDWGWRLHALGGPEARHAMLVAAREALGVLVSAQIQEVPAVREVLRCCDETLGGSVRDASLLRLQRTCSALPKPYSDQGATQPILPVAYLVGEVLDPNIEVAAENLATLLHFAQQLAPETCMLSVSVRARVAEFALS